MRARLVLASLAAAGVALLAAGVGRTGTITISGSTPNGGCGPTHGVAVAGPSRIDVSVSSTAASGRIYVQILTPNGSVAANSPSFDTSSGGPYGVRICSYGDNQDANAIQYSALIGTGPRGQPALPTQQAEFASSTITHSASGNGAIRTRAGLVFFTVDAVTGGPVSVRVDNAARHLHLMLTSGLHVMFGFNSITITGDGIKLTVVQNPSLELVTFHSHILNASGRVARDSFLIA